MSVEVSVQKFLFLPYERINVEEKIQQMEQQGSIQSAKLPFIHSPLHDLESLWWVAVWIVFYNEFRKSQDSDADTTFTLQDIRDQLTAAQTLFPPTMQALGRRDGFQLDFSSIYEKLKSPLKDPACYSLDLLRYKLVTQYKEVEKVLSHSTDVQAFEDGIYEDFKAVFASLQELEYTLTFIPDIYAQLQQKLKRPRVQ